MTRGALKGRTKGKHENKYIILKGGYKKAIEILKERNSNESKKVEWNHPTYSRDNILMPMIPFNF